MGHFVELVLEILFGIATDKPDKMPEIEYAENFVIRYSAKKTLARICATLIITATFSLLWIFIKHETRFLFALFSVLGAILLILSLTAFSFRCTVSCEGLCRSSWWIFKKELNWEDITCVRTVEGKNEKSVIIALYDRNGKCKMDFNTDMQNVWYIIKMAEQKRIEIKNEKDLTLKKINHL